MTLSVGVGFRCHFFHRFLVLLASLSPLLVLLFLPQIELRLLEEIFEVVIDEFLVSLQVLSFLLPLLSLPRIFFELLGFRHNTGGLVVVQISPNVKRIFFGSLVAVVGELELVFALGEVQLKLLFDLGNPGLSLGRPPAFLEILLEVLHQ